MLFCCLKRFSSNSLLSQFPLILHLIILYSFKFKSTMLKLPTWFHISQSISYLHQNKFICSISFLIELLFIFHIPSALHIALNKILQNIRLHLIKLLIKLSFLFPISSNCDACQTAFSIPHSAHLHLLSLSTFRCSTKEQSLELLLIVYKFWNNLPTLCAALRHLETELCGKQQKNCMAYLHMAFGIVCTGNANMLLLLLLLFLLLLLRVVVAAGFGI